MGLRLFFLPNFAGATFIQRGKFILDSRVIMLLVTGLQVTIHLQVECAKTRKYHKPDPTWIFWVFSAVTWETWNFIKWNPAPYPNFRFRVFSRVFSGFEDSRVIMLPVTGLRVTIPLQVRQMTTVRKKTSMTMTMMKALRVHPWLILGQV